MLNSSYEVRRPSVNSASLLYDRQHGLGSRYVQRRLHASAAHMDRLELETMLRGHEGCVNCLEWSGDGRWLASGSDDYHIILWDTFRQRRVHTLHTNHAGNIFSVKFLPSHNDAVIASAAADKYIYVADVHRAGESILQCHCHTGRVKRLATAPDSPFVFWSAGEDGAVLQLDLRGPHQCRNEQNRVKLFDLKSYLSTSAEAKCLAINPRRTEFLAIGANDPYARIYDRRMLHPVSSAGNGCIVVSSDNPDPPQPPALPRGCVTYYCPGHINTNKSQLIEHESRAITYLTYNAAGTELLVNMGGEHIYLYDLQGAHEPIFLNLPDYQPQPTPSPPSSPLEEEMATNSEPGGNGAGDSNPTDVEATAAAATNRRKLPNHIEAYKKIGNDYLENEKYLSAIDQYSTAISLAPHCAVLYLNRATAYMRRLWYGDVYAALRDCHLALRLDPSYIKAHFRLARALLELGRAQEADECLSELIARFPNYSSNHGVMMLHKDIREQRNTTPSQQQANEGYNFPKMSHDEYAWRSQARDYAYRYVGHCNTTTDIKEANYFGYDGAFIVAGSDDGNFFIWERETGKIRAVYKADAAIVNCVQPHPDICLLATSGIDHDIKLWSPVAASTVTKHRPHLVSHIAKTVEENQLKMKTDPFDLNTRTTACWNG